MDMRELGRTAGTFGGIVHGECSMGTDVEFPNLVSAGEFISKMKWEDDAFMLLPALDFSSTVVVTIPNHRVRNA